MIVEYATLFAINVSNFPFVERKSSIDDVEKASDALIHMNKVPFIMVIPLSVALMLCVGGGANSNCAGIKNKSLRQILIGFCGTFSKSTSRVCSKTNDKA